MVPYRTVVEVLYAVQYKHFIPTSAHYNNTVIMPCDVMMSIASTLRYYASQSIRY